MKYVNQLGVDDWIKIHESMFPGADFNKEVVEIHKNSDSDHLEVSFLEAWDEGEGRLYLKNSYIFTDFNVPECPDCTFGKKGQDAMKKGFFSFMLDHFSLSYLQDFVFSKTDVKFELEDMVMIQR